MEGYIDYLRKVIYEQDYFSICHIIENALTSSDSFFELLDSLEAQKLL